MPSQVVKSQHFLVLRGKQGEITREKKRGDRVAQARSLYYDKTSVKNTIPKEKI